MEPLEFFTSVFQSVKKEIVKALSGSKRKGPVPRTEVTVGGAKAIQQKKAKYEWLQSAAMELTIKQHGVLLGMSARGITVNQKWKNILQAPTAHVKYISVFSQGVLISSGLIHHCSKHDIPIDFFKGNGELYARFHDPSNLDEGLWQAQLRAQSDGVALRLAKAWAANKVNNQIKLLKYFHKYQKKDTGFMALFAQNADKLGDYLLRYGRRANYCVFECMLTDSQYEAVKQEVPKLIDERTDSVLVYRLCKGCFMRSERLGGTEENQVFIKKIALKWLH